MTKAGTWKPHSMTINGETKHIAARVKDPSKPTHAGNIENHGEYTTDRDAVQALCDKLNAEIYMKRGHLHDQKKRHNQL